MQKINKTKILVGSCLLFAGIVVITAGLVLGANSGALVLTIPLFV